MNLFDLTGKTAVIIGGNSTLGGAMASRLAVMARSSHRRPQYGKGGAGAAKD